MNSTALIHRLSPGDIWIPDNRASSMMVNDLAKQQASIRASPFFESSTTSSSNSSLASKMNINPEYYDQAPGIKSSASSIATPLSRQSSTTTSQSIRHKPNTAQLKEYGQCYKRLGEGTTAVVMVVRKLDQEGRSEKLYAIKQFRKKAKNESDKEYMKKLTSEFCISSTFSHPNVVETIDLVLDDRKRYCTVMEYCPGGDLFMSIMAERMTNVEKYCCFKQMIQGLAYLHSLGVAHRDIKPENLLLTMDGKLKITDFGVSDVFRFPWESKGRQSRGLVGSEPYIAPESFAQKEYWGSCADMWSAGIVFYCMLMGGLAWHKARRTDATFCGYTRAFEQGQIFDLFKTLELNERRILHLLLDPNPNTRVSASELLNDAWVKSIQVCTEPKQHKHTDGIQPVCKITTTSK